MMDTFVSITIYAEKEPENWHQHVAEAFNRVHEIEEMATSYSDSSAVGRVNSAAGEHAVEVPPDVIAIIRQAIDIGRASDGAFDISILPVLRLWHFKSPTPSVPDSQVVAAKRRLVDFREVRIDSDRVYLPRAGMGLDLGGIAKGYAVDCAAQVLSAHGYRDFLVEAGGDLRAVAGELTKGLRKIWIRHPRQRERYFAYIEMDDGAVATSGDYERYFELGGKRYHHIIDPGTGYPSRPVVSVTIFAGTTALADAYSTAVFVLGPQRGFELLQRHPEIAGLIIYQDGATDGLKWRVSKNIEDKLHIMEDQN